MPAGYPRSSAALLATRLQWSGLTGTLAAPRPRCRCLNARRRAGGGGKNVVTRGLRFPATEEEAPGARWLQARRRRPVRRRRPFREQLDPAFVGQQLDSAFGQQL